MLGMKDVRPHCFFICSASKRLTFYRQYPVRCAHRTIRAILFLLPTIRNIKIVVDSCADIVSLLVCRWLCCRCSTAVVEFFSS